MSESLAVARPTRLDSLTALRFLFALNVVLFHLWGYIPGSFTFLERPFQIYLAQGHLGVAGFFVLSGFVLTWAHLLQGERGRSDGILTFYWKRIARIYPLYLFGMLLSVLPSVLHLYSSYKANFDLKTLTDLVLALLALQAWTHDTVFVWNAVSWTLSVEAFFYLLFPLIIGAICLLPSRALMALLFACVVVGASLDSQEFHSAFTVLSGPVHYLLSHTSPLGRLVDFVSGIAVGALVYRAPVLPASGLLRVLALGVLAQMVVVLCMEIDWFHQRSFIAMFAVLFALFALSDVAGAKTPRVLVYLGEISFALYIVHLPILHMVMPLIGRLPVGVILLIYLPLTIGAAMFAYHKVELPYRHKLMAMRQRRREAAGAEAPLSAAMAAPVKTAAE